MNLTNFPALVEPSMNLRNPAGANARGVTAKTFSVMFPEYVAVLIGAADVLSVVMLKRCRTVNIN